MQKNTFERLIHGQNIRAPSEQPPLNAALEQAGHKRFQCSMVAKNNYISLAANSERGEASEALRGPVLGAPIRQPLLELLVSMKNLAHVPSRFF
jgi:hypothetical protein